MRRRDFLGAAGAPLLLGLGGVRLGRLWSGAERWTRSANWLLVPMDDAQTDHLKAYGVAYRVLQRGGQGGVVPQLP